MTWHLLEDAPKTGRTGGSVTLSVSRPGKQAQRAMITVKRDDFPEVLTWWVPGGSVAVAIGADDDAGRIRFSAGGSFRLSAAMGARLPASRLHSAALYIRNLPGMPQVSIERTAVPWEIVGEVLIISLPWAAAEVPEKASPVLSTRLKEPHPQPLPVATVNAAPAPKPPEAAEPVTTGPVLEMVFASAIPLAKASGHYSETHGIDLVALNAARIAAGKRPIKLRRGGAA